MELLIECGSWEICSRIVVPVYGLSERVDGVVGLLVWLREGGFKRISMCVFLRKGIPKGARFMYS